MENLFILLIMCLAWTSHWIYLFCDSGNFKERIVRVMLLLLLLDDDKVRRGGLVGSSERRVSIHILFCIMFLGFGV